MAWGADMLTAACSGEAGSAESSPVVKGDVFLSAGYPGTGSICGCMSSHCAGEQESGYESKQEYEKKNACFPFVHDCSFPLFYHISAVFSDFHSHRF